MPTLFLETPDGEPLHIHAPEGGKLIDLCDDLAIPIPFSCRSASCGTCRIVVLEGADQLHAPEDEEADLLDVFGAAPDKQRLACQAKMRKGLGVLRVRPVNDSE
jgi:2Fe-2S ferredoxin